MSMISCALPKLLGAMHQTERFSPSLQVHTVVLPGQRQAGAMVYSPNGLSLAAATADGHVCVLEAASRCLLALLPISPASQAEPPSRQLQLPSICFGGDSGLIYCLHNGILQVS